MSVKFELSCTVYSSVSSSQYVCKDLNHYIVLVKSIKNGGSLQAAVEFSNRNLGVVFDPQDYLGGKKSSSDSHLIKVYAGSGSLVKVMAGDEPLLRSLVILMAGGGSLVKVMAGDEPLLRSLVILMAGGGSLVFGGGLSVKVMASGETLVTGHC